MNITIIFCDYLSFCWAMVMDASTRLDLLRNHSAIAVRSFDFNQDCTW